MTETNHLIDLIGSRICHDLISPLGAIGNGVELLSMSMSGAAAAPELALIGQAVESANARIRFFRVAFGAAGKGSSLSNSEIRSTLSDAYSNGRMRVEWSVDTDVPRGEAKLAFLLLQCIENALPRGGAAKVSRAPDTSWMMVAEGERQNLDPALWQMVTDQTASGPIAAPTVHFALVAPLAAQLGRKVTYQSSDNRTTINF